ncbi:type-F conjugative transfer system pilin assembly thiol-disulfide isomerase TrbB, partial [Enterobacter hormaechei subsp. xiangfangensis]
MNLRHTVFTVALMTLSLATQASTMDEIKSLWHPQGARASGSLPTSPEDPEAKPLPAKQPVWYRLSNGRQVNLADWKVVLFMQGHCPYCHQFDPVL